MQDRVIRKAYVRTAKGHAKGHREKDKERVCEGRYSKARVENRSHARSRLKRDLRNPFWLCSL